MDNAVNQRRALVFGIIYVRSLNLYSRLIPLPIRWLLEFLILVAAILTLSVWGYVHYSYMLHPTDCLGQVTQRPFPRDVILQVEVYSNGSYLWEKRNQALLNLYETISSKSLRDHLLDDLNSNTTAETSEDNLSNPKQDLNEVKEWSEYYCDYSLLDLLGLRSFCKTLVDIAEQSNANADDQVTVDPSPDESLESTPNVSSENEENYLDAELIGTKFNLTEDSETVPQVDFLGVEVEEDLEGKWRKMAHTAFYAENRTLYELFDFYSLKLLALDYSLLEFTQETGFLSLTTATRARLNISVVKIYVDPDQSSCFGGPFGNFLTKYFIGYDIMVIASFKNLLPEGMGSGYVKDLLTGSHYYYKVQWMGKWRYLAGLLPAMFFTLVASVLLRQVHYHVFKFLTHFQHLLNQGIPMPVQTGAQIPFLIVTYAAIGLIIVMSEALSDDSMFSVLMVATVWEVDQFYAIYCRHQTSKMYFPWFFFLYHFLPYAYFVRFNGQFWFLPFLFHWLMTQHAMVFFVNHCELPVERLRLRIVHAAHPHVHLRHQAPPPAGAQPDIHQPNNVPIVHIDVAIGGQQPNVQPPVPGGDVDVQDDIGPREMRIPLQGVGNPASLRRRVGGAAIQSREGAQGNGNRGPTFVEESNRDEGGSELVSGSSTGPLFSSSTRQQVLQMRYSLHNSTEGASPSSSEPGSPEGGLGGVLSRESIRTARLNRFQRTNHDSGTDLADQ